MVRMTVEMAVMKSTVHGGKLYLNYEHYHCAIYAYPWPRGTRFLVSLTVTDLCGTMYCNHLNAKVKICMCVCV